MSSLTSSERRGILVVAALALLVTGVGAALSYCGRPEKGDMSAQVKILYNSDSISGPEPADSVRNKVNARKKGGKDGKTTTKKESVKKSFPKRSFLDEPI